MRITLPLGGLVNQRVQVCIRGCLTLKCSGLWKTVVSELSSTGIEEFSESPVLVVVSGEIGTVSKGTGCEFATAAIFWIRDI
jgi:hypothetical protein